MRARSGSAFALAFGVLGPAIAFAEGTPLGPEFQVNSYTTANQSGGTMDEGVMGPSVARSPGGNFVIVWHSFQETGADYGVFGQRYAASGAPLGPEFHVNTYTTNSQTTPSVAMDGSGTFVVVWQGFLQAGAGSAVFGQRYAGSGAPLGGEFQVATSTTGSQKYPAIASDAAGNFVVAWESYGYANASLKGVFGRRFASSGAPLGGEFQINGYTTGDQRRPALAFDVAGNFVVVWDGDAQDGSLRGIFGRRYASTGAALGPEFRVNSHTTNNQSIPSVSADSGGNFVVVWQGEDQDAPGLGVFGQRYSSSGSPVGSEFQVNSYTPGDQKLPSVASDASGNFTVVWQSNGQDGSNNGVFGQRFAFSGAPLGTEFRVNTYTTLNQEYPAVASDSSGNFVVAWSSSGQDGSSTGVFGQRFGTPPFDFYTLSPCRLLDTRDPNGPFGGPALPGGGAQRTFTAVGRCGIPAGASAISANVAVTGPQALGFLRVLSAGAPVPLASTINFGAGQTRTNNAIILLAADGSFTVENDSAGTVQLILDVNGLFASADVATLGGARVGSVRSIGGTP